MITDISIFVLTTDDYKGKRRQENVKMCLDKYKFKSIKFIIAPKIDGSHAVKVAAGHNYILNNIITNNIYPSMILEDDISDWDDHILRYSEFPNDADLVYVGVSLCSAKILNQPIISRPSDWHDFHVYYQNHDNGWMKMTNMLGAHAIIYNTPKAALYSSNVSLEAMIRDLPWDVLMANTVQPMVKCYVAKHPWFYQDARYGGQEGPTKIIPMISETNIPTIFNNGSYKYTTCGKLFNCYFDSKSNKF